MTAPTPPPPPEAAPPPGEPGLPAVTEGLAGPTIQDILAAATPRVWVTPALTGLVAACFGASLLFGVDPISPTAAQVLRVGGSFGPSLLDGEWWRLLTSAFLHFGLLHIAFNLWAFWSAGQFAERLYGNAGLLAIYLLSALGGSLLGAAVKPLAVSAGASGAVFGAYGALMAFAWTHRGLFPAEVLSRQRTSLLTFLGYNLVYGLASANVSLAGHGGGLLVGLAAGWLLRRDLLDPAASVRRRLAGTAALVLALGLCGVGLRSHLAAQPRIRSAALAEQGDAAEAAGRHEEAVARYTAALEVDPDWRLRFDRAIALHELNRLEEARRDASEAAAAAPADQWRPIAYLGLLQYQLEERDDAERTCAEIWRRAVWTAADFRAGALVYCVDLPAMEGNRPLALQRATRLVEVAPDAPAPRRARAQLRQADGDLEGALNDIDRAIGAGGGDARAFNFRAWLRVTTGDFARAKEDADRALAQQPRYAPALGTRCFALAGLERREEARRDCAQAVELAPPGAPEDRGMAAYLDGDLAGAARLWTEATRARPGEARALAPWLERARRGR